MPSDTEILKHMYDRFNARDMEAVLATMHRDVVWANGMEGGHVYGHNGVREYWTRQWAMIDGRAEPAGFSAGADGTTDVYPLAPLVSGKFKLKHHRILQSRAFDCGDQLIADNRLC